MRHVAFGQPHPWAVVPSVRRTVCSALHGVLHETVPGGSLSRSVYAARQPFPHVNHRAVNVIPM